MARKTRATPAATSKVVLPVRHSAWLAGDLGDALRRHLQCALDPIGEVQVSLLPRGLLVESPESPGPLLEAVRRAAEEMERAAATAYPVFHHEMGPLWTGTLQSVFPPPGYRSR